MTQFAAAFLLSVFAVGAENRKPFSHAMPQIDLLDGYVAEAVAAAPLVRHPIMATVDDRGRLFVGDSSGVNLNKAELEKELPHRVLMLEDTDGDGIFDKSTVFADKLTFPQGCAWLNGALYVASPPGIWRFTDTDGDGVADQREMIVRGFDYTGNAADIHGPFVHPNGRLYWCHGRKGHEVIDKDGTLIRKGKASGIWSCRPDGSDVRMHCGGGMDNPVEIDFTPEGEILGTVNLFYGVPRGDCLVHWLRGGVYPRDDMGDAIAEFKRTGDLLPPVHNFGHVAVSGCAFYRSGALNPEWRGNLFVTHFNTQRVTRMEIDRVGATYKATEREFLKIRNADVHITDVLEDRDGTLLVVDTGGWFRAGCPSSLIAKPDVTGAIYRIRPKGPLAKGEPWGGSRVSEVWRLARSGDVTKLIALLGDKDAAVSRASANAMASIGKMEADGALTAALANADAGVRLAAAHGLGMLPKLSEKAEAALLHLLEGDVERSIEHQVMDALLRHARHAPLVDAVRTGTKPALQRRALIMLDQMDGSSLGVEDVLKLLDAPDAALASTASDVLSRRKEWTTQAAAHLIGWQKSGTISSARLALIEQTAKPRLSESAMREVLAALLESKDLESRRAGWRLLAASGGMQPGASWPGALKAALRTAAPGDVSLVLDAIAKLQTDEFASVLRDFYYNENRPIALRLKALSAGLKKGAPIPDDGFTMLTRVLVDGTSISASIEAARVLGAAKLSTPQLMTLVKPISTLGPLELKEVIKAFRKFKDVETGSILANALKTAVALASLQESEVKTILSGYPPAVFDIVAPALREIAAEDGTRRRRLESLPALIAAKGRANEGRKVFETGKGTCIACHRIGEVGNLVGPNLSTIGLIRTERDLCEAILFPNATIVREFEPYVIETARGDSWLGIIRRRTPDTIVLADAAGQEHSVARDQIASMQMLPTSLMPTGLDRTLTEQELLDLVAYLRSRK